MNLKEKIAHCCCSGIVKCVVHLLFKCRVRSSLLSYHTSEIIM